MPWKIFHNYAIKCIWTNENMIYKHYNKLISIFRFFLKKGHLSPRLLNLSEHKLLLQKIYDSFEWYQCELVLSETCRILSIICHVLLSLILNCIYFFCILPTLIKCMSWLSHGNATISLDKPTLSQFFEWIYVMLYFAFI